MADISTSSIVRESRFYSELRNSVESGQHQDFHLLLSMVCQDATQLDEFHQPTSDQPKDVSNLSKQFFVSEPNHLGDFNSTIEQANAVAAAQQSVKGIHLNNCLNPAPLVSDVYDLPAEVFDNMDLNQRQLVILRDEEKELAKESASDERREPVTESTSHFDAATWFNVLAEARTLSQIA